MKIVSTVVDGNCLSHTALMLMMPAQKTTSTPTATRSCLFLKKWDVLTSRANRGRDFGKRGKVALAGACPVCYAAAIWASA